MPNCRSPRQLIHQTQRKSEEGESLGKKNLLQVFACMCTFSCNGKFLGSADPADCCQGGDHIPCPSPPCKQNIEATHGGSVAAMNKHGTGFFRH